MSTRWEHFSHQADIGIRGYGSTLAEAFEQAAVALTAVVTDPSDVAAREPVEVVVEAPDPELLLVEWLNGLIYNMATERMLFSRFEVEISGERLHGRAWGEHVNVPKHQPAVEVKGATYTELRVFRASHGDWAAQCVVDV